MTEPTPIQVSDARLREILAGTEGVTPGPWFTTGAPWFRSEDAVLAGSPDGNIGYLIADCEDAFNARDEYTGPFELGDKDADAAHIARLDPATVASIITELLSLRSAQTSPAVEVREIPWCKNGGGTNNDLYSGELAFNTYYTIDECGPLWRVYRSQFLSMAGPDEVGAVPDIESAKALAQADYASRIKSALSASPPSVSSEPVAWLITRANRDGAFGFYLPLLRGKEEMERYRSNNPDETLQPLYAGPVSNPTNS